MKTSKYFAPQEFNRCTPSCTIDQMDQTFLDTQVLGATLRSQIGGDINTF